jgi:hypothetical protein
MATTEGLEDAMSKLSILGQKLDSLNNTEETTIDDLLVEAPCRGKRKRTQPAVDRDQLRRNLEEEFLRPSTTFSPEWLNRFQQYAYPPQSSLSCCSDLASQL